MAMVVTVLALMVLLVLGIGLLQNSVASLRVAANDRAAKAALTIAQAGAEYARETLRVQLKSGQTLSQVLTATAQDGPLVNATRLSAFGGTTALVNQTGNRPLVGTTRFAAGDFQVFLTNDRKEPALSQAASVQLLTDSNGRVMLTSFGSGPGGSVAAVQEEMQLSDAFQPGPSLPGTIILPGPTVNFRTFTSTARQITGRDSAGNCYPTVATTSNAADAMVRDTINTLPNRPNYQSCPPWTGLATENFLRSDSNPYDPDPAHLNPLPGAPFLAGDPRLIRVNYLNDLVAKVKAVADSVTSSQAGVFLGSTTNPRVVFIDGDATFTGSPSGAGILLVTGTLTFNGTPNYHGVILVIGTGSFVYNATGSGTIAGAIFVANTTTAWTGNSCTVNDPCVGVPTYADNGAGNSIAMYDGPSLAGYAVPAMPLLSLSFQQLR